MPAPARRVLDSGLLIGFAAYASFAWGDALIKGVGGRASVFAIGLVATLAAAAVIGIAFRPEGERWRGFWRMRNPLAVQARALSGALAGVLGIYAFTTIPLAEAYALIFLAPLLVTLLSALALGERVGPWRWSAVAIGLLGVLLVLRPGFRAVEPGHAAAFGVALCAACSVVLLRALAGREKGTSLLGVLLLYAIALQGGLMLATGAPLPGADALGWIVLAGVFAGLGQIALLAAARRTEASGLAPIHYTQIGWAVLLGALFFDEHPDRLALAGLLALALAGLLTALRERALRGR